MRLAVYDGAHFRVVDGASVGDTLSLAQDAVLDDVYQLAKSAEPAELCICGNSDQSSFDVCAHSAVGTTGNTVRLESCVTLMAHDGTTIELLILVELRAEAVTKTYGLALGALEPGQQYRLIEVDWDHTSERLAQIGAASFAKGTRITMAGGEMRAVEEIVAGDRILTRDHGAQPVRWIGQSTLRARGCFAPVEISPGTFGNPGTLLLNGDHRIMIRQHDNIAPDQTEALVKARHLVNGTSIKWRSGGFVSYFKILLDSHEIIYAEGVASESLLLDVRGRLDMPEEVRDQISHRPKVGHASYTGELSESSPEIARVRSRLS